MGSAAERYRKYKNESSLVKSTTRGAARLLTGAYRLGSDVKKGINEVSAENHIDEQIDAIENMLKYGPEKALALGAAIQTVSEAIASVDEKCDTIRQMPYSEAKKIEEANKLKRDIDKLVEQFEKSFRPLTWKEASRKAKLFKNPAHMAQIAADMISVETEALRENQRAREEMTRDFQQEAAEYEQKINTLQTLIQAVAS